MNDDLKLTGKNSLSKYRTSTHGAMSKSVRFRTQSGGTPSPWLYEKEMRSTWSKGTRIGSADRKSFVDSRAKTFHYPGPGNYNLPSEFGHYKRMKRL
jgi:hypothetical protein